MLNIVISPNPEPRDCRSELANSKISIPIASKIHLLYDMFLSLIDENVHTIQADITMIDVMLCKHMLFVKASYTTSKKLSLIIKKDSIDVCMK